MPLQTAGWYESWADWDQSKVSFTASALTPLYDVVLIAFAQPDCSYVKGQKSWIGTGIQFSGFNPFSTVQQVIKDIKAAGSKVILSVGGQTYNNWAQFNLVALDALVTDLGCDGLELDFELTKSQKDLLSTITGQCVAKPWETWIAAFSVGAYDGSQSPAGSEWEGVNLPAIKAHGSKIAGINIMAYNAGPTYNPLVAYDAFRKWCPSTQINIAWMVPPEDWGGTAVTLTEVRNVAKALVDKKQPAGMCVWTIQRNTSSTTGKVIMEALRTISPKAPVTPKPDPDPVPPRPDPVPEGGAYVTLYEIDTGNPIKVPVIDVFGSKVISIFDPINGEKVLVDVVDK